MSTAVASTSRLEPLAQCPFSQSKSASPLLACPFSASSNLSSIANRIRTPAPPRAPTDLPDLTKTPSSELLYLPPLLSLLPTASAAPSPKPIRSFDDIEVGYTSSRLPTVDAASVALHHALHGFKPTTINYAYDDYPDAFNFGELQLPVELEREWYIVAFRSTRAPNSVSRDLYEADRLAHEEAVSAGGLLLYWYGKPNSHGVNLATCIWMSRADAVAATSGPQHIQAMSLAAPMYASYNLERYVLRKAKGETGLTVEPWRGGEVSFGQEV